MSLNDAEVQSPASPQALDQVIEACRAIVGSEHVTTGAGGPDLRDPYWPEGWQQFDASACVQPDSVEQLQQILRVANAAKVPLWTSSQGRNKGYGGGSPRVRGSVAINLRRMNRIIEIDETLGYALVEPGVSFMQLAEALRASGSRLMVAIPDFGGGSVIGNALEHGVLYGPYAADHMSACGMEVLLADGELLRTGMGAMSGSKSWNLFRRGLGPAVDPLFLQSNFGIVVKMGVWLMPRPEVFSIFNVSVAREEDLGALADTLRELRLDRTLDGVPRIYNTMAVASMVGNRQQFWQGPGPVPEPVLEALAQKFGTGRWMCHAGLWDDQAIAEHKLGKLRAAFERIPGAAFSARQCAPDEVASLPNPADRVLCGHPEPGALDICHWPGKGVGGHTANGLVAPMTGRDALALHTLARRIFEQDFGLDYMGVLMQISARSYIHMSMTVYDTTDEAQSRSAYDATRRLIEEGARLGYGEYRAHLYNMDFAAQRYDFNSHALQRMLNTLKDALDPNGILAPGKQAIWPQAYRR